MSVRVRSRGFELSDALRTHAERRLRRLLGRFRMRLRSVILRLDDVNGPRGGNDKRCRIVAQLAHRGEVRVEEVDGDLYAAIARAADRLERAVARATERRLRARRFRETQGGKETARRSRGHLLA
jgi:ribosomal subunit interface protein